MSEDLGGDVPTVAISALKVIHYLGIIMYTNIYIPVIEHIFLPLSTPRSGCGPEGRGKGFSYCWL